MQRIWGRAIKQYLHTYLPSVDSMSVCVWGGGESYLLKEKTRTKTVKHVRNNRWVTVCVATAWQGLWMAFFLYCVIHRLGQAPWKQRPSINTVMTQWQPPLSLLENIFLYQLMYTILRLCLCHWTHFIPTAPVLLYPFTAVLVTELISVLLNSFCKDCTSCRTHFTKTAPITKSILQDCTSYEIHFTKTAPVTKSILQRLHQLLNPFYKDCTNY